MMFQEIYYWMYTRLCKIKSNDMSASNAVFLIVTLQSFNIATVFVIINYYAKIHFAKSLNVYIGLSLAFVLCVINYFLLYAKREKIFKKYENISAKRNVKGLIYFWLYVLLSTIIFFVAAANLVPHKYQ